MSPTTADQTPAEETSPWQFVHPADYALPSHYVARKVWRSFFDLFTPKKAKESPLKDENIIKKMPHCQLAHKVPPPPWQEAAQVLWQRLSEDSEISAQATDKAPRFKGVTFIIGQPFSDYTKILDELTRLKGIDVIIKAPNMEQILTADNSWFEQWPMEQTNHARQHKQPLWYLPHLEHCMLRTEKGLALIRHFLNLAIKGTLGSGIIACDSWSWAFIQKIFPLTEVPALTLQAFDGNDLHKMLYERQANTSENSTSQHTRASDEPPDMAEFTQLAVYCRGNLALASTYWREQLRLDNEPTHTNICSAKTSASHPANTDKSIVHWSANSALPMGNSEETLLVLHAMLLHNGLPESQLDKLLPFSDTHSQSLLSQLLQVGIVQFKAGRWYVKELSYLMVRRQLSAHNYLTDEF